MFLAGFVFPRAEYQHAAGCDAIEHTVAELVSKTSVRQKREPPEKAALFVSPSRGLGGLFLDQQLHNDLGRIRKVTATPIFWEFNVVILQRN